MPILRRGAGAAAAAARIISAVPSGVGRAAPAPAPAPVSNRGAAVQRVVQQAPPATNRGAAVQRMVQQIVQQAPARRGIAVQQLLQPRGVTSGGAMVTALPRTGAVQRLGNAYDSIEDIRAGSGYGNIHITPPTPQNALQMAALLQEAGGGSAPRDSLLQLRGQTRDILRLVYPGMPLENLTDDQLIAAMELARQQDYRYRVPAHTVPDPPEMQALRARQDEIGDAFDRFQQTMRRSRRPRFSGVDFSDPIRTGDMDGIEGTGDAAPQTGESPEAIARRRMEQQSRFGRITQGMSDTQQMFDQPNLRSERAQAILDRITPEMAQTERLLGESNRGEIEGIREEQDWKRTVAITQEIEGIRRQLAAGNLPVDERVALQQRLEELERRRAGIVDQNNANDQTLLETIGNIGPEDIPGAIDRLQDIGRRITPNQVEDLGERVSDQLRELWDDPSVQAVVDVIIEQLPKLDWGRQQITKVMGRGIAAWAFSMPYILDELEDAGIPGIDVLRFLLTGTDIPEIQRGVLDAVQNGYTAPDGTEWEPGEQSVWEYFIEAATGDEPWWIRGPVRIFVDLSFDPLTYLAAVAKVGAVTKVAGEAVGLMPDAGRATRMAGSVISRTGRGVELAATAGDSLFLEPLFHGVGRVGRRMFGSLLDESIATAKSEAHRTTTGAGARAEEAIKRAGDRPPDAATDPSPGPGSRPPAAATTIDDDLTVDALRAESAAGGFVTRSGRAAADADALDDAADVARDTPSATAAADDGDLSVDALREESASGGFVTRSGHVADDGGDTPPVASTVDEAAVITADADGVITVRPRGIPNTLPNLRRAAQRLARVADSPAARTGMRQTGDDLLTPTFGGTRVQDEVFTAGVRAVDIGDFEAARVLDAELEDLEVRAIEAGLGSESTFLRFNEGGAHINTSSAPLSDTELAMFRGAAGTGSDTAARSAANRTRNGAVKGAYELVHKLRFDAQNRVNVHRRLFGDRPLPTTANPAFRTATDASFTDERLYWLMEEFVVTPDGARAQAIKDVLNRVDDQGYFREGPNGPYLTAIPPDIKRPGSSLTMREEIDTLLSLARKEYHDAIAGPPKADDATRIGGGLKAESKAAAEKIRKAEAEEARVTANAALKNTAEVKKLEEDLLTAAQDLRTVNERDVAARRAGMEQVDDAPAASGTLKVKAAEVPNTRQPLSQYTDTLYADMGYAKFYDLSLPGTPGEANRVTGEYWSSNNPDLALGQGLNTGILAELDPAKISGHVNKKKPGWDYQFDNGNAEFISEGRLQDNIKDAFRAFTFDLKAMSFGRKFDRQHLPRLIQWMEESGHWRRVDLPDGRIRLERAEDASQAPSVARQTDAPTTSGEIIVNNQKGTAVITRAGDEANGYTVYKREGSSQGNPWVVEGPDGTKVGRATKKDAVAEARRRLGAVGDEIMGRNIGFIPEPIRRSLNLVDRYNAGRWATVTEADTGMAAGVRDPNLRWANESGELDVETTLFLDQEIDWIPPFDPIPGRITKLDWADGGQLALDPSLGTQKYSVWDAINWHKDQQAKNPDKMLHGKPYDYDAAYQRIAELAVGFEYNKTGRAIGIKGKEFGATAQLIDRIGKTRMLRWYDTAMNVIQRQHRRYGPLRGLRNFVGDSVGTAWQLAVMGEFNAAAHMNWITLGIDTHAYRGMKRDLSRIAESIDHPFLAGTGQMLPNKLWPGVSRGEDVFAGLPDLNRVLAPYGPARHLANIWSLPVFKDALTQIDITSRKTMWIDNYEHIARREGMPSFVKTLNRLAGDEITAAEWVRRINAEAARHTPVYEGAFSPGDIRKALDGVTNQNTALARAWQSELTKASDKAVKRTEDVLFTYRNTNADEIARRIFVFHYWQTRAIPLHLRATLRNPILLSSYYKMWDALEQMAEEGEYPPYLSGMIRFYKSPQGIEAFGNVPGLLTPTTIMDMYDEKGQPASVLINQMAPPVAAVLAVLGVHDQVPDMTATFGDESFARRLANYLKGEGVDISQVPVLGSFFDPTSMALTSPSEDLWKAIFDGANNALEGAGFGVGDFTPFNKGANELDQMRTWVQHHAMQQFGPRYIVDETTGDVVGNWTTEQMNMYAEAMEGVRTGVPGNPLSDAARESYGHEEGLTAAFSLIVPAGAPVASRTREDIRRRAEEYREQGLTGDANQRAAYEFRQEASASDPTWQIASTQFHNLGTEESRDVYEAYWNLVLNPEQAAQFRYRWMTDEGTWTAIQLPPGFAQMSQEDRQAWADQWLLHQPGGKEMFDQHVAERDAFMVAHPEYQDFKTYQGGVYDYEEKPGGIRQWREVDMKAYPNFQHEMEERRQWLKDQGYTGAVLEAELDKWATTEAAFLAVMGKQDNLYDDAPLPAYDPSADPLAGSGMPFLQPEEESGGEGGGSGSGSSGGSRGDRAFRGPSRHPVEGSIRWYEEELAEDIAKWNEDNRASEAKYPEQWDETTGTWHKWVDKDYYHTSTYPSETALMEEYRKWSLRGGTNGDTSIEAFIAWLAENTI
jgi:hypothetical protein